MTSTPVKRVDALMNFVGGKNLTLAGGTNQTGSFGELMSKTAGGGSNLSNLKQPEMAKVTSKDAAARDMKQGRTDNVKSAEAADRTAEVSETTSTVEPEQAQVVQEAGEELVKEVAKELGVSEEEILKAMEELGLSLYQLFDPANLTQLVLNVSGETEATALLTDEGLFAKLQDVLKLAEGTLEELAEELNLRPEDLKETLGQLKAESDNIAAEIPDEVEEAALKITIDVKVNGETVKLSADENGNVEKTIGTVSQEAEEVTAKPENQKQEGGDTKGKSEGNEHSNALFETALQDRAQVQEAEVPQQTQSFFSEQTQDIMNQIMDYMKIQLRPGMDQLEMQLHPASLGSVQIQITSRGGEVTAHFQVQNETVKAALESQIMELKESLKDQGVKVEAVQVTVENHGFESNLWQGQGREQNAGSQNGRKAPRRINLNELDELFEEEASEEEILNARVMEMNGTTVDYTA